MFYSLEPMRQMATISHALVLAERRMLYRHMPLLAFWQKKSPTYGSRAIQMTSLATPNGIAASIFFVQLLVHVRHPKREIPTGVAV